MQAAERQPDRSQNCEEIKPERPTSLSRGRPSVRDPLICGTEDAVQDAFATALERWPDGAPLNPGAWILTVARNRAAS